MKKTFLSYYINFIIILISISLNANAQENPYKNSDSLKQKGIITHVGHVSKKVAILMRDTTLSGNRFDYLWYKTNKGIDTSLKENFQLPAFLIDSSLAAFCDSLLIVNSNSEKIHLTSWPEKKISNLTKKSIRLFIGYIDDKNDKNVVIQFISLKEFKKYRRIYSEQLFLVVPRKELHFVIINLSQ